MDRRRYRRHSGVAIDVASLRWHQGVVCLRVLFEVAVVEFAHRPGERLPAEELVAARRRQEFSIGTKCQRINRSETVIGKRKIQDLIHIRTI